MKSRIDVLDDDNIAFVYSTTTDALGIAADHAADIRNSGYRATRGDMGQVASIPDYVVMNWCIERGVPWAEFMRTDAWNDEFLNSDHAKPFRTWAGRV